MNYLKLELELLDYLEPMEMAERGRLLTAMLLYAREGTAPEGLEGERYLWPVVRQMVDRERERDRRVRAANAGNSAKAAAKRAAARAGEAAASPWQLELTAAADKAAERPMGEGPGKDGGGEPEGPGEPRQAPALLGEPGESGPAGTRIVLPLGDAGSYFVFERKVKEWEESFPGVDVMAELGKMRHWLLDNPGKRRQAKDLIPFVLRWLKRVDERNARARGPSRRQREEEAPSFDLDEIRRQMHANAWGGPCPAAEPP